MDFVFAVERPAASSETILGRNFRMIPGGKGANQAFAAAKLTPKFETAVRMIGRIGADAFGRILKANLQCSAGVDVAAVLETVSEANRRGVHSRRRCGAELDHGCGRSQRRLRWSPTSIPSARRCEGAGSVLLQLEDSAGNRRRKVRGRHAVRALPRSWTRRPSRALPKEIFGIDRHRDSQRIRGVSAGVTPPSRLKCRGSRRDRPPDSGAGRACRNRRKSAIGLRILRTGWNDRFPSLPGQRAGFDGGGRHV